MHIALIAFLIISAIGSFANICMSVSDARMEPGVKVIVVSLKTIMFLWALVLAILLITK